jgi:hypothetical protein
VSRFRHLATQPGQSKCRAETDHRQLENPSPDGWG